MGAKKTKYLTYIEDTRKHHPKINDAAKKSVEKAISNSQEKQIPVTYLEGVEIVKVASSGQKVTIGEIKNNRRKVKIGAKTTLSES